MRKRSRLSAGIGATVLALSCAVAHLPSAATHPVTPTHGTPFAHGAQPAHTSHLALPNVPAAPGVHRTAGNGLTNLPGMPQLPGSTGITPAKPSRPHSVKYPGLQPRVQFSSPEEVLQLPPEVRRTLPPEVRKALGLDHSRHSRPGHRPGKPARFGGQRYRVRSIHGVPSRTALAVVTPHGIAKTPNADEARPGLSIVKLYIGEYTLNSPRINPADRYLVERMIRFSDDSAATRLYRKYPNSISFISREYGLRSTYAAPHWGDSSTSARDAAVFLDRLQRRHPDSPVLQWMRSAAPIAADGTHQNWGTAHLPGAMGTKWGWSDYGPQAVASASIGNRYTAAAFTYGGPAAHNADVRKAIPYVR